MKNIDAERAAFEAWAWGARTWVFSDEMAKTFEDGYYIEPDVQTAWAAWQAGRRTPSASIGEDGLPELPEPDADLLGDGQYPVWREAQVRQAQRDAVAADRRRPKREMPPEMKAAIEEAHKTRSTGAMLPDGSAVFINYGDQPEDMSHLDCTACGGSGHIDDQRQIAGHTTTQIGELVVLLKDIRPSYGAVGTRDVDVAAQQQRIDRAIDLLRAAWPAPLDAAAICDGVAAKSRNSLFRSGAKICAGEIRAAQQAEPLTRCAAGRDGECGHAQCPQLRDGEPRASGRHCPLDSEGGRHD